MQECIFCKIIAGKSDSYKIFEDDLSLVVMDKYPAIPGQVLVISKKHDPPGLSQMDQITAKNLLTAAKKVSGMMVKGLPCEEVTFMIEGLEIDHAHAKVLPVYSRADYVREIKISGKACQDEVLEINCHKIRKGE
jgi:histidine triad (HIT) family protein